jgi:pyruvate/2-oxoglutarate dehydrogenase complex dihydrolipoamide acyltransferase (E2) component
MRRVTGAFREVPFPTSRLGTIDLGKVAAGKHHVAGLLEVDVTNVLSRLRDDASPSGETSFFAWMVKTISDAIAADPEIHAVMGRRRRLVIFENIDISVIVEKKVQGRRVPLPLVIRNTENKSAADIHQEIRRAQRQSVGSESDYVLGGDGPGTGTMRLYYALPGMLRVFLMRQFLKRPGAVQRTMGTVMITSLGSVGRLPGWVIPRSMHNLCFALGSVTDKPWVVDGAVVPRKILHMTVLFDHDVVDGAPAARFISALVKRVEG